MGSRGDALRGRPDFCRPAVRTCIHSAVGQVVGGCGNRMAYSHGPTDPSDAFDPSCGFVFIHHGRQTVVRLGVAVRLGCGPTAKPSLGLNGVVWFTAVVIAAVFAWMFRLLIVRGANVLVALVLMLLAVSASTIHFLARPHVLSWLFTLAWFWILDSSERDCFDERVEQKKQWLWALPLLMLVWVNMHGGFLVGFVLLGVFFLALFGAGSPPRRSVSRNSCKRLLPGKECEIWQESGCFRRRRAW